MSKLTTSKKMSKKQSVFDWLRIVLQLGMLALVVIGFTPIFAVEVQGFRVAPDSEHTRLVIELDSPVKHQIMTLGAPERLVIDLQDAALPKGFKLPKGSGVIARVRSGVQEKRLRLVADLKSNVTVKSFLIPAEGRKKDRLVIDLYHQSSEAHEILPVKTYANSARDLVIAIDAGHGGKDPGSIGKHGTKEKLVVMQIAKRLANTINSSEGMTAFLVRDNDQKIQYRERMTRARKKDADLFISIHADSFSDPTVTGSSVYVLSQRGASSTAARWLADKVNSADLVGGVSLNDKDDMLASVLFDLSQNATIAASTTLGKSVLGELSAIGRVRKSNVQYANFAVLKSPDIPSILVETAYISNPSEEKKLKDPKHQEKIAKALYKGVKAYFKNNPPPNSLFAQQRENKAPKLLSENIKPQVLVAKPEPSVIKPTAPVPSKKPVVMASANTVTSAQKSIQVINHVIKRGETLSGVSIRYNVKLRALKSINNLKRDTVRVGQVLKVPVIKS